MQRIRKTRNPPVYLGDRAVSEHLKGERAERQYEKATGDHANGEENAPARRRVKTAPDEPASRGKTTPHWHQRGLGGQALGDAGAKRSKEDADLWSERPSKVHEPRDRNDDSEGDNEAEPADQPEEVERGIEAEQ